MRSAPIPTAGARRAERNDGMRDTQVWSAASTTRQRDGAAIADEL